MSRNRVGCGDRRSGNHSSGRVELGLRGGSRFASGEDVILTNKKPKLHFENSMSDLDLMIANGYGDVAQSELPDNWREVKRS